MEQNYETQTLRCSGANQLETFMNNIKEFNELIGDMNVSNKDFDRLYIHWEPMIAENKRLKLENAELKKLVNDFRDLEKVKLENKNMRRSEQN